MGENDTGFRCFFGGIWARFRPRSVDPNDDLRAAARSNPEDDFAEARLIHAERVAAERKDTERPRFR
jgi:hypothetical protein